MGRLALGNRFGVALQTVVACYTLGSAISFVVLTGDFLVGSDTGVLEYFANNTILYRKDDETGSRAFLALLITILFYFPLSLLRRLDGLKYTSAVSCLASIYAGVLTCVVYFYAPTGAMLPDETNAVPSLREHLHLFAFPVSFWEAVPIVNVAFTAHYNAGRYYQELSNRSTKRIAIVSFGAIGTTLLLYATVGVTGYLTFGRLSSGNVLENYAPGYALAIGARIALALVVTSTMPLVMHSLRSALFSLFWENKYTTDTAPRGLLAALAVGILVTCGIIGVLCTKIEVVLAYKGGIFGSCLVYIFPTLMLVALRVRKDRNSLARMGSVVQWDLAKEPPAALQETLIAMFTQRKNWCLAFMFSWGVVSGLLSVTVTILTQAGVLHK